MNKELCGCGKMATYIYMPGFSSGESPFFCDDCVPRGCSCNHEYTVAHSKEVGQEYMGRNPPENDTNWKWIEKDAIWVYTDDKGREYPCCEYEYDSEGFNIDTTAVDVLNKMVKESEML